MLENKLENIGFTPNHARLYVSLIHEGSCRVNRLSRVLNRPKSSVLDDLQALTKQGFVSRHKKANYYLFTANPNRLKEVFEKRRDEQQRMAERAQNIATELQTIQNAPSKKPQIEFFEGREGVRRAFEDTIKIPKQEILGYGTVEPQMFSAPSLFPEYYTLRQEQKIKFRGLLPITPKTLDECWKNDQAHLRKSFFIGLDKYTPIEINIYGDTTSIMSLHELFAVLIRSKDVANCFRQILELALKGAEGEDRQIRKQIQELGFKEYKEKIKPNWKDTSPTTF